MYNIEQGRLIIKLLQECYSLIYVYNCCARTHAVNRSSSALPRRWYTPEAQRRDPRSGNWSALGSYRWAVFHRSVFATLLGAFRADVVCRADSERRNASRNECHDLLFSTYLFVCVIIERARLNGEREREREFI